MPKKFDIFKIYEDCFTKTSGGRLFENPEFETAMNNFMLCRILRMNDRNLWIAEIANRYQKVLSKKDFYLFVYSICPKSFRAPFSNFIKKPKKEKEKETEEIEVDEEGYSII